jgi:hypothetical protein
VHNKTSALAHELIIGGFVYVLEAAPTAHVVDKDGSVDLWCSYNIVQELSESLSMLQHEPTLAFIDVAAYYLESMLGCVKAYDMSLVFDGVLLMFCRHP